MSNLVKLVILHWDGLIRVSSVIAGRADVASIVGYASKHNLSSSEHAVSVLLAYDELYTLAVNLTAADVEHVQEMAFAAERRAVSA